MTTYNIFDKEMYTETHHIIILNKQTNEIKTENKTYIFDGNNLMEINDPHEYNFKLFEIMQKIQKNIITIAIIEITTNCLNFSLSKDGNEKPFPFKEKPLPRATFP